MSDQARVALVELHAARLAMQGAFLALHAAVRRREAISEADLRVLSADFEGAGEEAAAFAALLARFRATEAPAGSPGPARVRS